MGFFRRRVRFLLLGIGTLVLGGWAPRQAWCAPKKQVVEHALSPDGRYEIVTTYGKGQETDEALRDGKTYPDRIFSLRDRRKHVVLGQLDHILQNGSRAINTEVTAYWSADGTRLALYYLTHYSYLRIFAVDHGMVNQAKDVTVRPGFEDASALGGTRKPDYQGRIQDEATFGADDLKWENNRTLHAVILYTFADYADDATGKVIPSYSAEVTGDFIQGEKDWSFRVRGAKKSD